MNRNTYAIRIGMGVVFLTLSGINVYLPNVGNLFDVWRMGFTMITFMVGWMFLLTGIIDWGDSR